MHAVTGANAVVMLRVRMVGCELVVTGDGGSVVHCGCGRRSATTVIPLRNTNATAGRRGP